MKATFKHKIKTPLKADTFWKEVPPGEEFEYCDEIIEACKLMERNGWDRRVASVEIVSDAVKPMYRPFLEKEWETYVDQQNAASKEMSILATEVLLEQSSKPPMETVGGSQLDKARGFLVRPWKTAVGAMNFVQEWSRIWQALFEFRIPSIHCCPFATFSIQGEYVSVVALPAVYIDDVEPVLLPDNSPCFASQMARLLTQTLCLGDKRLEVYRGKDGRYYLLHLKNTVPEKLENGLNIPRKELLVKRLLEGKTSVSPTTYIREELIPSMLTGLVGKLATLEDCSAPAIVKDMLLRNEMRLFGINMCFLYDVRTEAQRRIPDEEDERAKEVLTNIAQAALTEMLGRVLKNFVREDIANFKNEGKKEVAIRLDAINRVARLTLTKNDEFWSSHINLAMRKKFSASDGFSIEPKECHLPTVLRLMSTKIGCVFDQETGGFGSFPEITAAWGHEPLPDMIDPPPESAYADIVARSWEDASSFEKGTALQQAYFVKALMNTLLYDTDRDREELLDVLAEQRATLSDPSSKLHLSIVATEMGSSLPSRKEMLLAEALEDLKGISLSEGEGPNLSASGVGYEYLTLAALKESAKSPVLYSAAATATTHCLWVDLEYHPLLREVRHLIDSDILADFSEDDLVHCSHLLDCVSKFLIKQGSQKGACDFLRPHCRTLSSRKDTVAIETRREISTTAAELHLEEFGLKDHKTWLPLFVAALHCSYSSDNEKLMEIIGDLVKQAAFIPEGAIDRVRHHTQLETSAKKPATVAAIRAASYYGNERDQAVLKKFWEWADQSHEEGKEDTKAKETQQQQEPEEAPLETKEQPIKETPPPRADSATPPPEPSQQESPEEPGQKPAPKGKESPPDSAEKPPPESEESAAEAEPPATTEETEGEEDRRESLPFTPDKKTTTFVTPDEEEGNASDSGSPLSRSQSRLNMSASEREKLRQRSLRNSVFWTDDTSAMMELINKRKPKPKPVPRKQQLLDALAEERKKQEVTKVVYCKAAIFPLDKTPELPPPEETTPCFEVEFSSKVPRHPCETEMKKQNALRRAKAAMELANQGQGRYGQLPPVPTLRTALVEQDRGGSTMLVGPTQNDEHKHVHLSRERRRPHSTLPLPSSTAVVPSPKRALTKKPEKRMAFVYEYTHTTIGKKR